MKLPRRLALGFPQSWEHRRALSLDSVSRPGEGAYFVEWDPSNGVYGEDWTDAPRDVAGVLLSGRERLYHPIRIAQFALHRYAVWRATSDAQARTDFLLQANWLCDRQDIGGSYKFGFPWRKYGAPAGWSSAMAQGEAISVLLRAHNLVPYRGYADAAIRAAQPFRSDVSSGGVVWRDGGDLFFEEIAHEYPAHVFNGCVFALWGIWELWKCTGETWLGELAEQCSTTLRRWLPQYDTGWWTLYSLLRSVTRRPHFATLKYHQFHIAQAVVLSQMFDESAFAVAAQRWDEYTRSNECRTRLISATIRSLPERLLRLDSVPGGARA